ncbi:MAG: HlyC/CorC family transporter, partial [Clostridia bacterium]|nr:HlyC/CorC family transporter [Clostridia bacterium]
ITMEDILEEIVGDIWDENDEIEEEEVIEINETTFELDGDISVADFCETLHINEETFETESDTVGGWVLEHFEVYPHDGDGFEDEDLQIRVTILSIVDRRIDKLLIDVLK